MCVCVCVCVCDERERERGAWWEREKLKNKVIHRKELKIHLRSLEIILPSTEEGSFEPKHYNIDFLLRWILLFGLPCFSIFLYVVGFISIIYLYIYIYICVCMYVYHLFIGELMLAFPLGNLSVIILVCRSTEAWTRALANLLSIGEFWHIDTYDS